jgi:DNA helicase-2/ATP-dependent DNA helicase PcrA
MNLSLNAADSGAFMQVYYKMNAYLTKAMAEYAVNNGNGNLSLFDVLMECPDIKGKHVTRLLDIKRNIQKISKLNALEAIEFIVKVIGYGEYLKKQAVMRVKLLTG